LDVEQLEQLPRSSGVFSEDHFGSAKDFYRPKGDIPEVA
jgi:hypothetical protein